MDLGWSAAIPAIVTAVSTIIVRVLARKDKAELDASTPSPEDVERVRKEVIKLREDFEILRSAYFKQNPVVDNRGPSKG